MRTTQRNPQPEAWRAVVEEALAELAGLEGPLLPILHRLMERLGSIPSEAIEPIARALDLSRAEVHGVVTYYGDFRLAPRSERVIELCRAEACRACGSESLADHVARRIGPLDVDGRARGERFDVEPVFCLGLCALAPAGRVDGILHGRLTPARLDALIDAPASGPTSRVPSEVARVTGTTGSPAPSGEAPARVFVADDSGARAVGADAVADAILREAAARGLAIELVRTSARGAYGLEPLVEVEATPESRIGYGPVQQDEVASLFAAGFLRGGPHARALGPIDALPFLARQDRRIFRRAGRCVPLSLDDYAREGGGRGLAAALSAGPESVRAAVLESGLRGRGGAAFPAGIKWRTVAEARATRKYVVCNADEGDSGTFADRMLLEGDPFLLIEGMTIAAIAVGATKGFVYVRSEYPDAVRVLAEAIVRARAAGWLGARIRGSAHAFDLEVRVGAGSYVCGEETAMLESLEGRRGIVRAKPPLPAVQGLFGMPTLIQNVLTFASVPGILSEGAAAYRATGVGRSSGTMPFQLAGNVRAGGLVERPFGITLRELVFGFGGGTASGRPVKAIQVGGPLGRYVPESKWDVPLDYEAYAAFGAGIGHGGIVVHDDTADLAALARYAMAFCAQESCGKCTPCRIGSTRGVELIDRIVAAETPEQKARESGVLRDLCATMIDASLCAMGGMTPLPVLSALDHYPEDFGAADFGLEDGTAD